MRRRRGGVARARRRASTPKAAGARCAGDLIAREARITLGQLPEELRAAVRQVRVFGPRDLAQQLADEIQRGWRVDEFAVGSGARLTRRRIRRSAAGQAPVSAAFSLAAAQLVGRRSPFELSAARKFRRGNSSLPAMPRANCAQVGAVAGAVLLLVICAFGIQQIQLWRLKARWAVMQVRVGELETIQRKTRQYRPWFDESLRSLSILRQLTHGLSRRTGW